MKKLLIVLVALVGLFAFSKINVNAEELEHEHECEHIDEIKVGINDEEYALVCVVHRYSMAEYYDSFYHWSYCGKCGDEKFELHTLEFDPSYWAYVCYPCGYMK